MDDAYKGLTLNDDGTIDVDLEGAGVVHLPRPKIGQFLVLVEAMEQADAQFKALNDEIPDEDLSDAAAQMALVELGVPKGSAAIKKERENALTQRTMQYVAQLQANRLLMSAKSPFPRVWLRILKELGGSEVEFEDLPSWTFAPLSLSSLQAHWTTVPLLHGPTTNRADDANGQTTSGP
jgi:hypothetical protein